MRFLKLISTIILLMSSVKAFALESDYIKGVSKEQWSVIKKIGDPLNCEERVAKIDNLVSKIKTTANGSISGSVVFSDLDNDGDPEVVAATNTGDLLAFHIDGSNYDYFPILNDFPFSGSPMITDLDDDGDLEILAGSGSNLFIVDIKSTGNSDGYWNVFRESSSRNGCRFYSIGNMDCGVSLGDVSGDGGINILDLVQIANYILGISTPLYECAADFTMDQNVNILDLVQIANFILEN